MRRKTLSVKIGNITLSSEEPVMVQSMLNVSTMDTMACVEQAIRIIKAGGQLVRITAQGVKEAENLKNIRAELWKRGYTTPLSADIHFNPEAALVAARYVEKVRINPGNFMDKRAVFKSLSYTEEEYAEELSRLRKKFTEFLDVCRQHGTAVRIGTNHGSLSDRIMSRYGNTPSGMVEATMEYLRICKEEGFDNVVISLKSSDCCVMVEAVRLLVKGMEQEGMFYPLHLGVTEAGEGEDGRVRSAVGIGCLLNEGLGDTIRVSLTEAPEREIPVAKQLVSLCNPIYDSEGGLKKGNSVRPFLVGDISTLEMWDESVSERLGFAEPAFVDPAYGKRLVAGNSSPEIIYTEALGPELTKLPVETILLVPYANFYMAHVYNRQACPLLSPADFVKDGDKVEANMLFVELTTLADITPDLLKALEERKETRLVLNPGKADYHSYRQFLKKMQELSIGNKVIVRACTRTNIPEEAALQVAAHVGGLFVDRLADGLWVSAPNVPDFTWGLQIGRNVLQSVGLRRYKTEFVSCPGCGRTLYNLEKAVAEVKQAFAHLDNLKIAIMGCIVNGPGEMGDADYGYVGAGNEKVNLYKGREIKKVAVPEGEAIEALRQLIKENGDWKDC